MHSRLTGFLFCVNQGPVHVDRHSANLIHMFLSFYLIGNFKCTFSFSFFNFCVSTINLFKKLPVDKDPNDQFDYPSTYTLHIKIPRKCHKVIKCWLNLFLFFSISPSRPPPLPTHWEIIFPYFRAKIYSTAALHDECNFAQQIRQQCARGGTWSYAFHTSFVLWYYYYIYL